MKKSPNLSWKCYRIFPTVDASIIKTGVSLVFEWDTNFLVSDRNVV